MNAEQRDQSEQKKSSQERVTELLNKKDSQSEPHGTNWFKVEYKTGKQPKKAFLVFDSDDYVETILFWPIQKDGTLSDKLLILREDHEGDDDYYLDKGYLYFYECQYTGENKPSEDSFMKNPFDSTYNLFRHPTKVAQGHTVSTARVAKIIGDVDYDSLKAVE